MKTMSKFAFLALAAVLIGGVATLTHRRPQASTTLKVGAALVPHAEILTFIKPRLKQEGIDLQIITLDDENQLNPALAEKAIDANYFQHRPFLNAVAKEKGYAFVVAGAIHVEPIGFYSFKVRSKDQLKAGAIIGIPNNPSNEFRALALLESQGLIKLKPGLQNFSATLLDIVENPHQFRFIEVDIAQLPRSLPDLDGALINTNALIEARLDPNTALFREGAGSFYANDIVVRTGDEARPDIKKLVSILQSADVKDFLKRKYGLAIVPAFP